VGCDALVPVTMISWFLAQLTLSQQQLRFLTLCHRAGAAGLAIVLFEEATKLVREFGLEVWLPFLGASKSDMYEVFAQVHPPPSSRPSCGVYRAFSH
jgi:hypothetical protein